MSNFDGFEKVEERFPIYEPCIKKDEEGEKVNKRPTDKSWMKGYYLGFREIKTKEGNQSKIHDFQFIECGDMSDFNGEEEKVKEGSKISMWGRTALDDKLVSSAPIGQAVVVKWIGKQKNQAATRSFHVFELLVHPTLSLTRDQVNEMSITPIAENKPVVNVPISNSASTLDADDDDDLPF